MDGAAVNAGAALGHSATADLDAMRAVVLAGDGVVMRFPGLLCVFRPGSGAGSSDADLERLMAICADVSAAAPVAPGRLLARRLAGWLGSQDGGPDFGTLATTETGIGVFLHGALDAVGADLRLSGSESGAWLDRLLPSPEGPIAIVPTDQRAPEPDAARAVFDLRVGVVPGAGVQMLPGAGVAPVPAVLRATPVAAAGPVPPAGTPQVDDVERAGLAAPATPADADVPSPVPDGIPGASIPSGQKPELRAPQRIAAIAGVAPEERRSPLEVGGPAPSASGSPPPPAVVEGSRPSGSPTPDGAEHGPQARGFKCSRDHLNDPRNQFCIICGIRMDERTGVAVLGTRPPLGLLVFDDGSTYTVDADYLLGRTPEADPRVRDGELRPLSVLDPDAQVSRGHLVIRLAEWDVTVVDESRNGTFVARPAETSWSRLAHHSPLRLDPGTRIRIGARSFIFESPSGVR